MTIKDQIIEQLFGREIERRARLAAAAYDDAGDRLLSAGHINERDRFDYDREQVLRDSLEAWRVNPLARRIVALTTQHVVGGGMGFECRDAAVHAFLQDFWGHPLNRLNTRLAEWCDELSRAGELFILLSSDAGGMSYVRAIPALDVVEISAAGNDFEQELAYRLKDDTVYPGPAAGVAQSPLMLHYAVNRPVGAQRGESDLAPILKWLSRYAAWLEDRARLNRFRTAFTYVVTLKDSNDAERRKRQAELNLNPPGPGSILVKDESEDWSVISPQLAASEAGEDGIALKRMIAVGAGVPMHFLAEPEGATQTTAESASAPTRRFFEQRQEYFEWLVSDVLRLAVQRAIQAGCKLDCAAPIRVKGADFNSRDNAELAGAAARVINAFGSLRDRGLIDDAELLRMAYRFAGEVVDVEDLLRRGKSAPQSHGGITG